MKVSRKILKALIKECLLELLTEGLGDNLNEIVRRVPRNGGGSTGRSRESLPIQAPAGQTQNIGTDALRQAVIQEAGGDPILQDILADTAVTTLPTRLASETAGGMPTSQPRAGLAEAVVAEMDPQQLVGEENASRWANLAFDTKTSSISHMLPPPPALLPTPANLDAPVGQPKKTA